jgi:hypothetical protein
MRAGVLNIRYTFQTILPFRWRLHNSTCIRKTPEEGAAKVAIVNVGKEININVVGNPVNGAMVNFTVIAVNGFRIDSIPTIADKATVVWVVPFSGEA